MSDNDQEEVPLTNWFDSESDFSEISSVNTTLLYLFSTVILLCQGPQILLCSLWHVNPYLMSFNILNAFRIIVMYFCG